MRSFSFCVVLACLISCRQQPKETTSSFRGNYDDQTLWPQRDLLVCWENPEPINALERSWIATRIQDTWGKEGGLSFFSWESCVQAVGAGGHPQIRIRLADKGPYTVGLGTELDGVEDGMLLNVSFKRWSPLCSKDENKRRSCIESTAIHEFGHALGFAHEHNRKDRDVDCIEPAQGRLGNTLVGPYDSESIMNYCGLGSFANRLSEGDKETVRVMYGTN